MKAMHSSLMRRLRSRGMSRSFCILSLSSVSFFTEAIISSLFFPPVERQNGMHGHTPWRVQQDTHVSTHAVYSSRGTSETQAGRSADNRLADPRRWTHAVACTLGTKARLQHSDPDEPGWQRTRRQEKDGTGRQSGCGCGGSDVQNGTEPVTIM